MNCADSWSSSPWGWGSSTRHGEAVSLLRGLRGGTLPGSLVALLLCTCRRWDRVTAKLIVAVDECGVLSGADLDELAESLLSDEVVAVFPLAWISPQWLDLDTADGTTRTVQVSDEVVARDPRRVEPPLRRWAAARALRNDPARLDGLLECADGMPPRHRDALLHGLLDASASLTADQCRQLVRRALRSGIARVRRAALDRLCELDGPGAALCHAPSDADRTVRAWRPPGTPTPAQAELPGIAPSLPVRGQGLRGWATSPTSTAAAGTATTAAAPCPRPPTGWFTSRQSCPGGDPGGHGQPRHLLTAARSATAT